MKRTYWSLTAGRLVIQYGFRRRPWPTPKNPCCVITDHGEDSTTYKVYLFGKKFFWWSRTR